MIDSYDTLAALTADYLNVYILDLESEIVKTLKLQGYVIEGLDKDKDFPYSPFLERYISARVYEDDKEMMRKTLESPYLKDYFKGGKTRLEKTYRVDINGEIHHYSALYALISKPNEPIKLVVGFRCIDEMISLQNEKKREGLIKAYEVISDTYICMYRVNLENDTYSIIKTDPRVAKCTPSSHFSENIRMVVDNLAKKESRLTIYDFLEPKTLESRMKGRKRISVTFEGNSGASYALHFLRESSENSLALTHVIFAVEPLDEDKYQSVFDVLAGEYVNVFWINLNDGNARILKMKGYIGEGLNATDNRDFHYPDVYKRYIIRRAHPEDQAEMLAKLELRNIKETIIKSGRLFGTYRVVDNGQTHYFRYEFFPIKYNSYAVAGFRNIDDIIAEHHASEEKEKQREEEHRKELEEQLAIFNILSKNYYNVYSANLYTKETKILKLDSKFYQEDIANAKKKSLTFPFDTVIDNWAKGYVHPDDQKALLACLNSENLLKELSDKDEYSGNYRSLTDGVVHTYQYKIFKVDDKGNVLAGFQNVDKIIADHLEEERKRREKDELYKTALRKHSEVISSLASLYTTIFHADVATHEYEILSSVPLMNEVAAKKGNFDEMEKRIIDSFMAQDYREPMRIFLDLNTLSERLRSINTVVTEYRNAEGKWFQARFIAKRRNKAGEVEEVLYVAREITKEKEQELRQEQALRDALLAAKHASRAKTTFLNNMSHDIRTPMNAIIGFTALAKTHIDNVDLVKDYLTKIHTSSTHLLSLINEILDMSRIESGTVRLDANPVHLPDVLHDLRTMIQGQIGAKSQNLYIDTLDVTHEDVITDKLRLNQVLLNIVSNAMKYTGVGGDISIRVQELPCPKKGHATYEFSVKDNGIGMSKEFQETVFDAFSRERSSTVSGIQGTGLGMSITKNIVDLMNGEIKVESELGKGSTFTVTVDFRLAEGHYSFAPIPNLRSARALVVDDDISTCQSVCKMLREIEMRPDWSSSGKEAIIRAKESNELKDEYKVYIIDYLMPDMNGIETVRQIRKVISEEIPIIVLTAYDWSSFEEEAKEAGVTAFVAKPLFMSELRAVLSRPEAPLSKGEESKHYDYSGKRVLLVEDNDLNREIARSILIDAGIEVDEAKDGIEAVEAINREDEGRYDLVLMDIQMPRMDGYTATREIRTLPNNVKANIPIVAMTANAFEEDKQKAFEAGMNGHIAKPISMEAIAKALDEVFANK